MEPQTVPAPDKRRVKFLAGGGMIAFALIGLVVFAMTRPNATSFYMTTTEIQAAGASQSTSGDVKVNGDLLQDSVVEEGITTTFDITDGSSQLTVTTDSTLPDAFYSDSDVIEIIAQGQYDGDTFTASQVFAKCPSKFKAQT